MTPKDILLKHFENASEIALAAGVTRQAVGNWFKRGAVSHAAAYVLAEQMGIPAHKLLVRWTPRSGRVHDARDAKKKLRAAVVRSRRAKQ